MARAGRVCMEPGCGVIVIDGPRCPLHRPVRSHGWGTSKHIRPEGWQRLVKAVMKRDRKRCVICGRKATEVDHLLPMAFGGREQLTNLRAMCHRCHQAKTNDEKLLGRRIRQLPSPMYRRELDAFITRWQA